VQLEESVKVRHPTTLARSGRRRRTDEAQSGDVARVRYGG
jgi:hypothetical protein